MVRRHRKQRHPRHRPERQYLYSGRKWNCRIFGRRWSGASPRNSTRRRACASSRRAPPRSRSTSATPETIEFGASGISITSTSSIPLRATARPAYSGDGGQAASASLNQPEGLAFDSSGVLYIADRGNSVVRAVNVGGRYQHRGWERGLRLQRRWRTGATSVARRPVRSYVRRERKPADDGSLCEPDSRGVDDQSGSAGKSRLVGIHRAGGFARSATDDFRDRLDSEFRLRRSRAPAAAVG